MNEHQLALRDKVLAVETDVNTVLYERTAEIHTAILALLARRHHFQLGPPGVAKSLLVEQVIGRIEGFEGENYFKWLLTKFTLPEEIFGGPLFKLLKEEGIYKRNTERKIPRARVSFLDETMKAGSSLLNTLLTLINEGEFYNVDDDPTVPLMVLFGASNEGPQTNELEALVDRFMFWHRVGKMKDMGSFIKATSTPINKNPEKFMSIDDLTEIQEIVSNITVPDEVFSCLWDIREELEKEEITVSDRRFHQCVAVIQAEAFMNGHDVAEVIDTKPLQHCFWRDPSHIEPVQRIVLQLADPLEKDALALLAEMEKAYAEFQNVLKDNQNKALKVKTSIDVWGKVQEALKEIKVLKEREKELGRKCPAVKMVNARRIEMCKVLLEDGIGLEGMANVDLNED